MREAHSAQHVVRLGELDVLIGCDLDPISPGIEEIEKRTSQQLNTHVFQRAPDQVFVVHRDTEVPALVGTLVSALCKIDELIAEVNEGFGLAAVRDLELEEAPIKVQRFMDI